MNVEGELPMMKFNDPRVHSHRQFQGKKKGRVLTQYFTYIGHGKRFAMAVMPLRITGKEGSEFNEKFQAFSKQRPFVPFDESLVQLLKGGVSHGILLDMIPFGRQTSTTNCVFFTC